ncbi:hypothetical protein N7474_001654 [Penicillium riverlandense]|uniref:uncharacterized protein n=1 Tax=Penicillium riverlandense TaxID=1903569 RepID=UPI002548EADA|nr:uncharacterized protein N7474_001654 [Penicillium riverlandense]KAJ5833343.1 hypothetical protein N7474_001654 [Penicillium riverlandense]
MGSSTNPCQNSTITLQEQEHPRSPGAQRDMATPRLPMPMGLFTLPPELLLLICRLLCSVDVACLSLCNHRSLQLLGDRLANPNFKIDKANNHSRKREILLTRLSKDNPHFYYCHFCSHLHHWDRVPLPGPAFHPNKPALRCLQNTDHIPLLEATRVHKNFSYYKFYYHHLQLAMRRAFYGDKYGISTRALQFTEIQTTLDSDMITLLAVEARIIKSPTPSLGLRIQNMIAIKRSEIALLDSSKIGFLGICGHLDMTRNLLPTLIAETVKTYLNKPAENQCQIKIKICAACHTDYKLEIKEYGTECLALVITKWLDLGSGHRFNDPKWKAHVHYNCEVREVGPRREAGRTRMYFETALGGTVSETLATAMNLCWLWNRNFTGRTGIMKWGDSAWISQPNSPEGFLYQ